MRIGKGNRSTRRKPASVPLYTPQIPYEVTWARTRATAVGSRRQTARQFWYTKPIQFAGAEVLKALSMKGTVCAAVGTKWTSRELYRPPWREDQWRETCVKYTPRPTPKQLLYHYHSRNRKLNALSAYTRNVHLSIVHGFFILREARLSLLVLRPLLAYCTSSRW
jgi:hypothetical protein